jgi:hypothetical protein
VLQKGVDTPFKVKAELLPTPDGRIRVRAKSIKAAGLPMKPLMNLLGIEMDDMVKIQGAAGGSWSTATTSSWIRSRCCRPRISAGA